VLKNNKTLLASIIIIIITLQLIKVMELCPELMHLPAKYYQVILTDCLMRE